MLKEKDERTLFERVLTLVSDKKLKKKQKIRRINEVLDDNFLDFEYKSTNFVCGNACINPRQFRAMIEAARKARLFSGYIFRLRPFSGDYEGGFFGEQMFRQVDYAAERHGLVAEYLSIDGTKDGLPVSSTGYRDLPSAALLDNKDKKKLVLSLSTDNFGFWCDEGQTTVRVSERILEQDRLIDFQKLSNAYTSLYGKQITKEDLNKLRGILVKST